MAERARSESCKRGAKKPTTWHLSLKPFYQSNVQSRLHVDTNGAISIQIVLCSDLQRKRIFASSIRLHYIQLSMQGVVSSSVAIKSQRREVQRRGVRPEWNALDFAPHPLQCIQGHHADGSTCRLYRWNDPLCSNEPQAPQPLYIHQLARILLSVLQSMYMELDRRERKSLSGSLQCLNHIIHLGLKLIYYSAFEHISACECSILVSKWNDRCFQKL